VPAVIDAAFSRMCGRRLSPSLRWKRRAGCAPRWIIRPEEKPTKLEVVAANTPSSRLEEQRGVACRAAATDAAKRLNAGDLTGGENGRHRTGAEIHRATEQERADGDSRFRFKAQGLRKKRFTKSLSLATRCRGRCIECGAQDPTAAARWMRPLSVICDADRRRFEAQSYAAAARGRCQRSALNPEGHSIRLTALLHKFSELVSIVVSQGGYWYCRLDGAGKHLLPIPSEVIIAAPTCAHPRKMSCWDRSVRDGRFLDRGISMYWGGEWLGSRW